MTDLKNMLARSDYNWIKCSIAQRDVKAVLTEFVEEDINDLQRKLVHNSLTSKGLPSNTICNCCLLQNLLPCRSSKLCKFKNKSCSFHKDASLQPRRCPTNGLCDDIRFGIIDHHRFHGPSWKNTDASKWCTDSWTIAKCYMPPDGYLNAKSAEETDFNGVINVIINCIYCQGRFLEDLNNPINVCTKARDKSRDVRHSPNLELSDDERDNIIDTLVDLLNDSKFFRSNQRSVECREKLTKLKANALRVSTTDITTALEDSVQSANQALEVLKTPNSLDAETKATRSNLINLADNLQNICTSVKAEIEKKHDIRTRYQPSGFIAASLTECGSGDFRNNSRELPIKPFHFCFLLLTFLLLNLSKDKNNILSRHRLIVGFTTVSVALCYCIFFYRRARSERTTYIIQHEMDLRQIEHTAEAVKTLQHKLLELERNGQQRN